MATRNDPAADVEALKADLARLRDDLSALRKDLTGAASERFGEAREAGKAKLDAMRTELDRLTAELKGQGVATLDEAERLIRDRPMTSLLAAFGIGLLLGHLFDRRR
jgi:ElaB/YqjD/DUF883 family membrane-anchored ribosome-binding protein